MVIVIFKQWLTFLLERYWLSKVASKGKWISSCQFPAGLVLLCVSNVQMFPVALGCGEPSNKPF